jgi:hypothetical protein
VNTNIYKEVTASKLTNKPKTIFLILSFRRVLNVVYFILGKSPASVFYWPTFRNSLSVPPAFEDGTDSEFRNVGQ